MADHTPTAAVRAYAVLPGVIVLELANDSVCLYTNASTGTACIVRMRRHARIGRGLSTLVRVMRNRDAARLRRRQNRFKYLFIHLRFQASILWRDSIIMLKTSLTLQDMT